jgi:uncharacterized membrane-anchored protein YitT (DUF2179 family)
MGQAEMADRVPATADIIDARPRHSLADDAVGFATGVVLATLGTHLLRHLGLVTGQTAGLALVLSYAGGWSFGLIFFLLNLPFYALSVMRLGWGFTLRTLGAVALFSVAIELAPTLIPFGPVQPVVGAVIAGVATGVGLLVLFRHRASLGGVGVLAVYIQDRTGFRAGWTQMLFDALVFAAAFAVIEVERVLISFLGAVVLNVVLALNHRRDRYIAQ